MRIAVEGCAHGALETIYATIAQLEREGGFKVDVLLCCGDFQATRNLQDLQTMAVSKKYRNMCTFYKYYSGESVAPMLTIFIGGNHEASNYLQELPYGGWVAPNIYYLGYAGVIQLNGLRIGGLSGIYKGHDYLRGRHEFTPYNESTSRSVYHVRQLEVFRLKQLSGVIHVMMSHDWPRGIYNFGNTAQLLRFKPFFRQEVEEDRLGSIPCETLLRSLKPHYWFAAHLHCQFAAIVPHPPEHFDSNPDDQGNAANPEERCTRFLALDKCLPRRRYLQIVEIEEPLKSEDIRLEYDLEWLTILHLTNHLMTTKESKYYLPGPNGFGERYNFTPTAQEMANVKRLFNDDLSIPLNFRRTADAYDPHAHYQYGDVRQPPAYLNSQTTTFCDLLRLDDPVQVLLANNGIVAKTYDDTQGDSVQSGSTKPTNSMGQSVRVTSALKLPPPSAASAAKGAEEASGQWKSSANNPDEIDLDDEDTSKSDTNVLEKEDTAKSSTNVLEKEDTNMLEQEDTSKSNILEKEDTSKSDTNMLEEEDTNILEKEDTSKSVTNILEKGDTSKSVINILEKGDTSKSVTNILEEEDTSKSFTNVLEEEKHEDQQDIQSDQQCPNTDAQKDPHPSECSKEPLKHVAADVESTVGTPIKRFKRRNETVYSEPAEPEEN